MSALTPAEIIEANRRGGRMIHRPEMLAVRLARAWPDCSEEQKALIRAVLAPVVKKAHAPSGGPDGTS